MSSSAICSMCSQLRQHCIPTTSGSTVVCYTSDLGNNGPILTLIHGYPQSSFTWRHLVPYLQDKISLFVPEVPGYGVSSPCTSTSHSKRHVGSALLEALREAFRVDPSCPRQVILGGHDRGARVSHRLALDKDALAQQGLDVVGTILLDIAPLQVQWEAFGTDPAACVGYFHWPFLANVELAVDMLSAYGGGRWCRDGLRRAQGSNEEGRRRFAADGAVEIYAALFEKETLRGTCEDYAQGAAPEVEEQKSDQLAGRKIAVPTLVMFSEAKLGSTMDVAEVWKDWVNPGVELETVAVGDGHGHFLPEEAVDWVEKAVVGFIKRII